MENLQTMEKTENMNITAASKVEMMDFSDDIKFH